MYRLIVEVLNDQNLFTESFIWLIGFPVMSSFVQVVISQNELKLLGGACGKMNHLKVTKFGHHK